MADGSLYEHRTNWKTIQLVNFQYASIFWNLHYFSKFYEQLGHRKYQIVLIAENIPVTLGKECIPLSVIVREGMYKVKMRMASSDIRIYVGFDYNFHLLLAQALHNCYTLHNHIDGSIQPHCCQKKRAGMYLFHREKLSLRWYTVLIFLSPTSPLARTVHLGASYLNAPNKAT